MVAVGAYFYPSWGRKLIVDEDIGTEWQLLDTPKVYFDGHKPPPYPLLGRYDVCSDEYVDQLIWMCKKFMIDFLVLCWYWDNGEVLDGDSIEFLRKKLESAQGLKYSLIWVQRRPHESFPIKPPTSIIRYHPEVEHRQVITSQQDLLNQVEALALHFSSPAYMQVNGQPLFTIFEIENLLRDIPVSLVKDSLQKWKKAIYSSVGQLPFLVGVIHHRSKVWPLGDFGFDAATSYVFLPDWGSPANQDHGLASKERRCEWNEIAASSGVRYIPAVTAGWDATLRGERVEQRPPCFPWSPVVTNSSPTQLKEDINHALNFQVGQSEPVLFLTSMNEWTEGHTFEPCSRFGFAKLETVRELLRRDTKPQTAQRDEVGPVLITDLDGTFVKESDPSNRAFRNKVSEEVSLLVYVTSREMRDVVVNMREGVLPPPDIVVSDVGAEWLWNSAASGYTGHPFSAELDLFPYEQVIDVTEGIYFLERQEILSKHRVSFFTQSKTDKDLVQRSLSHLPVDLIWSDGYLDVLPQGVNKRTCAEWIVRNILNKEQVLILAGNTETDQHLLIQSEQPSVRLIFPPLTKPFSELAGMTLARESFCLNSWKEACAIAQYSKTALKLR